MLLSNNLDSGPNGATITVGNSDDSGGTAFDSVVDSPVYAASPLRGGLPFVAKMATNNHSAGPACVWAAAMGEKVHVFARFYVNMNGELPAGTKLLSLYSGSSLVAGIGIASDPSYPGHFAAFAGPSQAVKTDAAPALDTWHRLEMECVYVPDQAINEFSVVGRYFLGTNAEGTTPDFESGVADIVPGAVFVNAVKLGLLPAHKNLPPTYLSGLALNDTGWVGPA